MKKQRIISPSVAEAAPGLWSNCMKVGSVAYLSGLTARTPDGVGGDNEYEQAKTIFEKMKSLVEEAGGQMDDIVHMTIYVTDIAKNKDVWAARREYFSGDFPACALVEVSNLAIPELLIEIQSIAHIGSSNAGDES